MKQSSEEIRSAITQAIHAAEISGEIFDVYKAAEEIKNAFPAHDFSLVDIVNSILERRTCVQAIEISPPAALIIDIFVMIPAEAEPAACIH